MVCSWKTALQWRCAPSCARWRRTVWLRARVWPQVSHPHPTDPIDSTQAFKHTKLLCDDWQTCIFRLPTQGHTSGKWSVFSRNQLVPLFCIFYCHRWCDSHHQWCQQWRAVASTHTWSNTTIDQQLKVSICYDCLLSRQRSKTWQVTQQYSDSVSLPYYMWSCAFRLQTVCGNVVKQIELEKRLNLLQVCSFESVHDCSWNAVAATKSSSRAIKAH